MKIEIVNQPTRLNVKMNATEATALLTAIASANVITGLPEGKTVADLNQINLTLLSKPLPDGSVVVGTVAVK